MLVVLAGAALNLVALLLLRGLRPVLYLLAERNVALGDLWVELPLAVLAEDIIDVGGIFCLLLIELRDIASFFLCLLELPVITDVLNKAFVLLLPQFVLGASLLALGGLCLLFRTILRAHDVNFVFRGKFLSALGLFAARILLSLSHSVLLGVVLLSCFLLLLQTDFLMVFDSFGVELSFAVLAGDSC